MYAMHARIHEEREPGSIYAYTKDEIWAAAFCFRGKSMV